MRLKAVACQIIDLLTGFIDPAIGVHVKFAAEHLAYMGSPALLPTPPFTVVHELMLDPKTYPGFVGHQQKQLLLPVQKAILRYAAEA